MDKQALVIGGTGFLGAAVVRELREVGWDVTMLARGRRANPPEGVPLLIADRSEPGALAEATRGRDFDLVVDCAAFRQAEADLAVEALRGHVGHYFFISTDFVYAAAPNARFPVPEDAPKQGGLPYAAGKLACEEALMRAWEAQRFPCTVLRPPHILGAGRPLGCDPLTMRDARLLERMRAGQEIVLLAEGQMLIQPVWNREIGTCVAHLAALEDPARVFGKVFNIAGPDAVTTRRYYEMIAEYLGVPLRFRSVTTDEFIRQSPETAHMARHRQYDLSGLAEDAGYRPRWSLEGAIHETAHWLDAAPSV